MLDLRQAPATPALATSVALEPTIAPMAPASMIVPEASIGAAVGAKTDARLARATDITKSDMIRKFPQKPASAASISTAAPAVPPPSLSVPAIPTAPEPEALPIFNKLPNAVASQVDSMKNLLPPTDAFQAALTQTKLKSNPVSVMAASLAIAIMGGYIWLHNYDNLSVKAAAQKAGISASVPNYLPSSYSLSGPISYGPGFVTLQFKSPSNQGPLVLSQRKTSWNSSSLLELFVTPKSKSFVTVQTQGLTIYVYNGNQATWVNRGNQYVLEGNTRLSKDQIVKIAESI